MTNLFSLAHSIDVARIANSFRSDGRVEIRNFLGAGEAEMLRAHLLERSDWTLILNAGDKVYEIPRSQFEQFDAARRRELDRRVLSAAREGFQYRYESIRVADDDADRQSNGTILDQFIRFMSSQPVLELLARIIDRNGIDFADGQATAYSPGHFLTSHDDDVEGKGRHAAYVLGLAPQWRAEWGGLLMFHGEGGNISEAFAPAMGALRLFSVPTLHSVSYVTPMAPEPRLSITGWLRTRS
jgi:Rps23 Pro-64 3,4-dihydroxylase Tpa1-like proline 4-hydroxylase